MPATCIFGPAMGALKKPAYFAFLLSEIILPPIDQLSAAFSVIITCTPSGEVALAMLTIASVMALTRAAFCSGVLPGSISTCTIGIPYLPKLVLYRHERCLVLSPISLHHTPLADDGVGEEPRFLHIRNATNSHSRGQGPSARGILPLSVTNQRLAKPGLPLDPELL